MPKLFALDDDSVMKSNNLVIVQTNKVYSNYVAKAAYPIALGPHCQANIKLGVAMVAPSGTYLTISPVEDCYKQPWEIRGHRLDKDENGEAVACIINHTNDKVIVTTGTPIGQIEVLRIRANPKTGRVSVD